MDTWAAGGGRSRPTPRLKERDSPMFGLCLDSTAVVVTPVACGDGDGDDSRAVAFTVDGMFARGDEMPRPTTWGTYGRVSREDESVPAPAAFAGLWW